MKKLVSIIISVLISLVAVIDGYWFFSKKTSDLANPIASSTSQPTSSAASLNAGAATSSTLAQATNQSGSQTNTSTSTYKDGTYTGKTIATQWGDVQVQVSISSGQISQIVMLKSTSADGASRSRQIDQIAEPRYISEATSANSSQIQAISGATETYDGFTNSLQNALTQAL